MIDFESQCETCIRELYCPYLVLTEENREKMNRLIHQEFELIQIKVRCPWYNQMTVFKDERRE